MHALIAEHESNERAKLVELCHALGRFGDLIVVGSGSEALKQILVNPPDVALLACELKDMSGFAVLGALHDGAHPPAAIMMAADDRYVAETLSSPAADYLTWPISADRLALALKRACPPAMVRARAPLCGPIGQCERLVGERGGRIYFLPPFTVDYIEADSQYVRIHVGSERYLIRDSLTRITSLLEGVGFVRISRSILLNLQRVSFAEREGRGVLAFVLESGARVVSSNGFRLEPGARLRVARTRKPRSRNCDISFEAEAK
jgi:DNA-binding LytR/AlgR family response regulator